jgi:GMP synthase (glutamine-hydrolysing)
LRELKLLLIAAIGLGVLAGAFNSVSPHLAPSSEEAPSVRVLILDNSLNHPIYTPARQWRRHLGDVASDVVRASRGDPLPGLANYTHIIITGSTASLVDPPEWIERQVDLVRDAERAGLSILGSCFGHQLLVYALSGSEYVQRADRPEIGWVAIQMLGDDELFAGFPNPWHAFSWHSDEVVALPEPWRLLGRSSSTDVQVIRYGDAPIWGLQAHPEISPRSAKSLLLLDLLVFNWRSEEVRAALRQTPRDDEIVAAIVERFLRAQERGSPLNKVVRPRFQGSSITPVSQWTSEASSRSSTIHRGADGIHPPPGRPVLSNSPGTSSNL